MKRILILIFMTLFLYSCASKTVVYQIEGVPVPDKVISGKVFALNLKIKYDLSKVFEVREDDESYETYEYIPLSDYKIHKISNPSRVLMRVNVFNPQLRHYKIIQHLSMEGEIKESIDVYEGNLSRKSFVFELPVVENKFVTFYYEICDKNDNMVYQSFRAQYIIEG